MIQTGIFIIVVFFSHLNKKSLHDFEACILIYVLDHSSVYTFMGREFYFIFSDFVAVL